MSEAQEVGTALRLLRERAGLSQRELAERLDVQQPAVARWEAGGVRIPINRIAEIVAELGYGIEYDLTAVPIGDALESGVPIRLVSRRVDPPETAPSQVEAISCGYRFAINADVPWQLDMWEATTGRQLDGAVAVVGTPILSLVAHPDGVLVHDRRTIGKITANGKRRPDGSAVFAYGLANRSDLDLAGVADDPEWSLGRHSVFAV